MTRSPEELAHDVVMLAQQQMSDRAIARALHMGRNRVRKLLRAHAAARSGPVPPSALPPPPATRPSVLDVHQDFIRDLLRRFPDITAQRVYEELCGRVEPVFEGRYTIVKALVRKLRPKPVVELSTPMEEPEPGKVAECDWATISLDFKNGTRRKLQIFGYTLAYSHRRYYRFYDRADFHALLDGHVEAFDHLDGLAAECKYDGQKTVVLRWEGPQPIYNPRFVAFATYYRFGPRACRTGHPNDKPHVELSFRSLRISFFNGRDFHDLDDLKASLRAGPPTSTTSGRSAGSSVGLRSSSTPRSSPTWSPGRAMSTTRRGSYIGCATWRASWRGKATATRCRPRTSPSSCRCGSRSVRSSCTARTSGSSRSTSSGRAAPASS